MLYKIYYLLNKKSYILIHMSDILYVCISLFPPHIRRFTYTKQPQNINNTDSSTKVNVKERRNVRAK